MIISSSVRFPYFICYNSVEEKQFAEAEGSSSTTYFHDLGSTTEFFFLCEHIIVPVVRFDHYKYNNGHYIFRSLINGLWALMEF